MTDITDVLKRPTYSSFVNANDSVGALAALLANGTVPPDSELWHWNGIINALALGAISGTNSLTPNQVSVCRDTLSKMPNGYLTLDALLTAGCALDDPIFQATVTSMEVTEPPEAAAILTAIAAIGQPKQVPQWQIEGLAVAPTLDTVTAAMALIPGQRIHNTLVTAWTRTSNAESNNQFLTVADAVAFFTQAALGG
jgi:hypothetical protein